MKNHYCERAGLHISVCELVADMEEPVQIATALVQLCHAGASQRLRKTYALKWWTEFLPERIMVSAMTSSTIGEFTAELSGRLSGRIGQSNDDGGELQRLAWAEMMTIGEDLQRQVLNVLELQATVCATLVRASADAFREERNPDG